MALWLAPALCGAPGRNHPTSQEGAEYLQPPQSRFKFSSCHPILFYFMRFDMFPVTMCGPHRFLPLSSVVNVMSTS